MCRALTFRLFHSAATDCTYFVASLQRWELDDAMVFWRSVPALHHPGSVSEAILRTEHFGVFADEVLDQAAFRERKVAAIRAMVFRVFKWKAFQSRRLMDTTQCRILYLQPTYASPILFHASADFSKFYLLGAH